MKHFSVEHMIEDSPYYDIVVMEQDSKESSSLGTKIKELLKDKDYGNKIHLTEMKTDDPIEFISKVISKIAIDRSIWIGRQKYLNYLKASGSPFIYAIDERDEEDAFIEWFSKVLSRPVIMNDLSNKINQKNQTILLYEKEKKEALDLIKVLEYSIYKEDTAKTKKVHQKIFIGLAILGIFAGGLIFLI